MALLDFLPAYVVSKQKMDAKKSNFKGTGPYPASGVLAFSMAFAAPPCHGECTLGCQLLYEGCTQNGRSSSSRRRSRDSRGRTIRCQTRATGIFCEGSGAFRLAAHSMLPATRRGAMCAPARCVPRRRGFPGAPEVEFGRMTFEKNHSWEIVL